MNKQHIRQTMLELEADSFNVTVEAYREYYASARLDRSETVDFDGFAQAVFAEELAKAIDRPIHDHVANLERLRAADFGPKSTAEEGAVVRIGGRNLVLAVPTAPFDCDGEQYMGVSAQAPIIVAMQDKAVGETFCFNGCDIAIESIT